VSDGLPPLPRSQRTRTGEEIGTGLRTEKLMVELRQLGLTVHGHDRGAAKTEVVLQPHLGPLHLALVGLTAELPGELGALRQAGGAQRVAF